MSKRKEYKHERSPAQQRAYKEMLGHMGERVGRMSKKRIKLLRARREITSKQAKELLA
jgi:hypothetical protein